VAQVAAHDHAVSDWLELEWAELQVALRLRELVEPRGDLGSTVQTSAVPDRRARLDVRVEGAQE
jgi:hypothetical protein